MLTLTRYTTITPARLSKQFRLVGGALIKEGGGNMIEGIAERLTVASTAEFAALLPTLKPNQATSYGINDHDRARVVVKEAVNQASDDLPVIARTRDYLHWPKGAGLLMLDYDAPKDSNNPPLARDDLVAALVNACPPLADAPMIWRPSASSCIYADEQELRGIAGQRLYIPVLDASDIPRAGQTLVDRLWLTGHGRYELSTSGQFLARTFIDASVFQPERLDFCGGASCGKGLRQKLPDPVLINPDAPYLDTTLIQALTDDEQRCLADIQETLKQSMADEQVRIREAWIASRVDERLKGVPEAQRDTARPDLEQVYRQAAHGGRLEPDFELTVVVKGKKARKVVTVWELLAKRTQYHAATTLDPLEPDYPEGQARLVGWLNLKANPPYLKSQAHGGTQYFLVDPVADEAPALARPALIRVNVGELPEATDEAEAALIKHGVPIYQRSGYLCRITRLSSMTVRGVDRPQGAMAILPLDPEHLLDRLNRLIHWERWSSQAEDYKRCHAPRPVATALLARSGEWDFPVLNGVVSAPTLRPDGSLLDRPGYDKTTGLLFDPQNVRFPVIPEHPTRAQAETALAFLFNEVLATFPFAAMSDRSAALSAILTALIRPMLKAAPLHTFDAPHAGSGKSLLADVVSLIATGQPATVMSFTVDPDEMRKRILSILLQGDAVINLDNLQEPLQGDALCSVLTQETFTDRLLKQNRTATAPTTCLWLATGNNLQVIGDMTRRFIPCRLDAQCERPEEREFSRNLYDWIPANRPALVVAGLTVLRAYIIAGKPKQPIKTLGSFEEWSGLVRSALVWLGEADPNVGRAEFENADPNRAQLRALLLAWWATFRSAGATSKEAVARANETRINNEGDDERVYPALYEVLEEHFKDRPGKVSSHAIGYFLRQHVKRIESGARFEPHGGNAARNAWRVVIVDEKRFRKIFEQGQSSQSSQHPNPPSAEQEYPKARNQAGFDDSGVGLGCKQGWDGCDSWDTSPYPKNFHAEKFDFSAESLPGRIITLLRASPAGYDLDEITRQCSNEKGASPAMIELALMRLVKEGMVGKLSGNWVSQELSS